jgi:hypothetical protein
MNNWRRLRRTQLMLHAYDSGDKYVGAAVVPLAKLDWRSVQHCATGELASGL